MTEQDECLGDIVIVNLDDLSGKELEDALHDCDFGNIDIETMKKMKHARESNSVTMQNCKYCGTANRVSPEPSSERCAICGELLKR